MRRNDPGRLYDWETDCTLCPRHCHAARGQGQKGFCGQGIRLRAARAALHYWEEPCISGEFGSGAVFFSGCTLNCVYCQNHNISDGTTGKVISTERLTEIFLELQEQKAWNINLVTAGHFLPAVVAAIDKAKAQGLVIPIVYNTSGYEEADTIRSLEGLVDIYLPDLKYLDTSLAERYSGAKDYPAKAKLAIAEMVRQCPEPVFDGEQMKSGVIVRHLVLPGRVKEAKDVIRYLYQTYGDQIYISIMNQYTPVESLDTARYPELGRRLTEEEYDAVVDDAIAIGVENGFIQEGDTAEESYIPAFDITGI